MNEGLAPRYRLTRAGIKQPQAAVFKRHGGERRGTVRVDEMNESEPVIKCRNTNFDDGKTGGWTYRRDNCAGNVYCCAQAIRHGAGMTSTQVTARNVGGLGFGLSVGAARSSDEAFVMGVERRGGHVREDESINCVCGRSA